MDCPLVDRKVEELFAAELAEEYRCRRKRLWDEVVHGHSSMHVLERLAKFPAGLLLDPAHQTFLSLVFWNFYDHIVLVVIKVLADRHREALTLTDLKKWMLANCHRSVREELEGALRDVATGDKSAPVLARARTLRSKLVAHLDRRYALDAAARADAGLSLSDLRVLLAETERLLSALSIGTGLAVVPMEYSDLVQYPTGLDPRSDIEYFLDLLAADSVLLKMPEEQREQWAVHARNLTPDERETFNYWRQRTCRKPWPFE